MKGYLLATGGAIDPLADDVAVTLLGANGELLRAVIPAGAMRGSPNNWHFTAAGGPLRSLRLRAIDSEHYRFRAAGRAPGLFAAATPYVAVQIDVGTATFGNAVRFRVQDRAFRYP